ncbi:MAG: MASE1 domain-containing protein [Thiobacillus sp.]|nr:MASE1 domain-containing protein [Thiobacillus sp.]
MIKPILLALAYIATGWLGLQIPYVGSHITLVWFPTGIAVAALLRWGGGCWLGIYVGAFIVNLIIGSTLPLAAGIAVGNTLGPILAVVWLKRAGFHQAFDRQRDVGLFIVAASLGMMVSALGGVANLHFAGLVPPGSAGTAWLTWWMGDAVGVLLVAPLLLSFTRKNIEQLSRHRRELLLWLLISCPVAWLAFMHDFAQNSPLPLAFLTLPLLAWAALSFGNAGAALAGLGFSILAAWGTATGHGTFYMPDIHIRLALLWSYITATVLTVLLITALLAERKHAEETLRESEEKLRGLYELSPLGIALTDMQGRFLEFNEAFQRICGYSAQELKDLDYWTLTPRDYEAREAEQLEQLKQIGRYGPYEKEYVRKDGSRVPLQLNGMLVTGPDGEQYIWSIVEEITERKRNERMKNEFVSTVSHELRTPLTSIAGALGLLHGGALSDIPEPVKPLLDIAYKNSQRLILLINDLLDMEKILAGKMSLDLQEQALMPIVEQALEANQGYGDSLGVRFSLTQRDDEVVVRVEKQRMMQVLDNFLSNAVKFSLRGGVVEVAVRKVGERVRVEVADHGPGIPEAFRQRVFQKFSQADSSDTRQKGGTGLGLAITKELVERMNGQVCFESEIGVGTKFFAELPVVEKTASKPP